MKNILYKLKFWVKPNHPDVKPHNLDNPLKINTFDIDGVIYINKEVGGLYPGPNDIVITGRSFQEITETKRMLNERGIYNQVFFNSLPFDSKTRKSSGEHKAKTIKNLQRHGYKVMCHFEDDEIQAAVIRRECPSVNVVMVVHELTNKENVRHP